MIHKFYLEPGQLNSLDVPLDSKILSVADQEGDLCLWVHFDDGDWQGQTVKRLIEVLGTGWPDKEKYIKEFIGTVLMPPLVWHVFERIKKCPE